MRALTTTATAYLTSGIMLCLCVVWALFQS